MRMRTALAAMVAAGSVVAVGCTPPPTSGGGSTTTTTAISGNPAAACYNASTGGDVRYSGTPNVVGNLTEYASTNGSCGGGVVDSEGILVLAEGEPAASAACFALGRESAYSPADHGITMSASAWFCTAS
jgi:hypothetical protein